MTSAGCGLEMQSAGTKITHIQGYLLFMEAKNASMLLMD
jgi:hypothetical protein